MMRWMILLALLAGCSTAPPQFPACPVAPPKPAALRKDETVGTLEIRVELWAEALLRRGNACAGAVEDRDEWIERQK